MTICAAVVMFTIVSCGESNPAIKAGEEFIDNPTRENFNTFRESIDSLSEDEKREYGIWFLENEKKLDEARNSVHETMKEAMKETERRIHDRLQEQYTCLSEDLSPDNNILSKDFTNLYDRADEVAFQYGDEMGFFDVSIWIDAQDYGKLTVLPFDSFTLDGDTAYVVATIEDSSFGNIHRKFEFVYEYGDWFVNDIISIDGGYSWRSEAERFIAGYNH